MPDPVPEEIISYPPHWFYKPLSTCHPAVREALSRSSSPAFLCHHRPCTPSLQPSTPLRLYNRQQRPNSWTKSRQNFEEFSSCLFTVTSTALPWDFYFFKLTQPPTYFYSSVIVHCKRKRKTIPPSLWFKKYKQKPPVWELRLLPETSTKLYVHELGFDTLTIAYVLFSSSIYTHNHKVLSPSDPRLYWAQNGTRFARCHFRAHKSPHFQGPRLAMALEMDLPASKSLRPAPCKQQVHKYLLTTT